MPVRFSRIVQQLEKQLSVLENDILIANQGRDRSTLSAEIAKRRLIEAIMWLNRD